ncbi:transporter substrate-binding domain-containing protein [Massilia sp. CCM 8695]|uniref:Transporter substrate-binding domain-containing protein n=1 Tax=Massilia frigida TaxID=2609281 RepID=A0ABX0NIF8_9BURK|nr:transporter substrate-binding domain-containing protein [Massilia frigida]NHZ80935.1 transporter substrate-binding domain-containing protein [Massilia frigida]
MGKPTPRSATRAAAFVIAVLVAGACAPALASCEQPFLVPVAPTGLSMSINGDSISGIYPDLLRSVSAKSPCKFTYSVVPRARQEAMFEAGKSDLLLPALRTPRRDQLGYFVPVIGTRATLLSVDSARAPVRSIRDLLARKELRVVLVRGFDYGDAYLDMIDQLSAQGRLLLEKDGAAVARVLDAGIADVTLMAPTVFAGAILEDKRFTWMMPKLRIEPLEELPWGESGIYISKQTVAASDRAALQNLFAAAIKSGAVYENLKRYYPPAILAGGVRPR